MTNNITRRDLLKTAGLAAAAIGVAGCATTRAATASAASASRRKTLTIAHITDVHLKPEGPGQNAFRVLLREIHARTPKPDLILNGGDAIMDALGATPERTQVQWDLWHKIMAEECTIPVVNAIGNHDIWGWQRKKAGATGDEPLYGKKWALKELKLERGYYGVDRGGWRIVVLDSVQERGDEGYKPMLDEEQFAWLEADLAATPATTPVMLFSHVPILSTTPMFFYEDIVKDYKFNVAGALMHQDVHRIKSLLVKHPNVKLALSGHCHLYDRVLYNGVTYICNGAASGNWWKGTFKETPPAYAVVTLYDDGSFDNEFVPYNWEKQA